MQYMELRRPAFIAASLVCGDTMRVLHDDSTCDDLDTSPTWIVKAIGVTYSRQSAQSAPVVSVHVVLRSEDGASEKTVASGDPLSFYRVNSSLPPLPITAMFIPTKEILQGSGHLRESLWIHNIRAARELTSTGVCQCRSCSRMISQSDVNFHLSR